MNRRGFIGAIGAALSGAVLDPERLLWRPGAKVISVPKPAFLGPRYVRGVDPADGHCITISFITKFNPRTGGVDFSLEQIVRPQRATAEELAAFKRIDVAWGTPNISM